MVNSRAEIARVYGLSRARVTQVMNLLDLPDEIQEHIIAPPPWEQRLYSGRRLQRVARIRDEAARAKAFEDLMEKVSATTGARSVTGDTRRTICAPRCVLFTTSGVLDTLGTEVMLSSSRQTARIMRYRLLLANEALHQRTRPASRQLPFARSPIGRARRSSRQPSVLPLGTS